MASNRWVAIDPDILTHPLVGAGQPVAPADPSRGAYSRMEAWLWIICNASFADHTVNNRGRKMTLQRGDLLGAWAFLAHTFNWSAKTVKAWVDRLIEDDMLQRRAMEAQEASGAETPAQPAFRGNQATILSIVNYWRFQFEPKPKDASNELYNKGGQFLDHQGGHQGDHPKDVSVSKLADKYILQQQQGGPPGGPQGGPLGSHITKDSTTTVEIHNHSLSETSSDEKKPSKKRRVATYSEAFEIFWTGYPDRTNNSKPKAFEEWERIPEHDQNGAMASLPTFLAYCRKNADYRCVHAERYLRERRWETFAPKSAQIPWWQDPAQIKQLTADRWREGIRKYANGAWPVEMLGPAPGHARCIVPPDLIEELRLTEVYDSRGIKRR